MRAFGRFEQHVRTSLGRVLGMHEGRIGCRPSGVDLGLQSIRQGDSPRSVETLMDAVIEPIFDRRADVRGDYGAVASQLAPA